MNDREFGVATVVSILIVVLVAGFLVFTASQPPPPPPTAEEIAAEPFVGRWDSMVSSESIELNQGGEAILTGREDAPDVAGSWKVHGEEVSVTLGSRFHRFKLIEGSPLEMLVPDSGLVRDSYYQLTYIEEYEPYDPDF